ncbi:YhcH/YjgK/YiaL family protein [Clostridium omnivorum]|uniref:Beta-D-galactosidase n=1 Tax=Clostridium omnivorum TaxID=1604902 RepID=A0ABQ5N9U5_9CLOT|nr:YhcH/YjgK/YiaL family protein [Clostridium sp. E14]GLC31866.1 beta-D-galactosidase [Clostridium sp. E14]
MIYDNIKNSERYEGLNINFKKAFEFLKRSDLKDLAAGRYEIDSDNVFALVQTYETMHLESKDYEVHKKYIDVQYMVKGEENMGFSQIDSLNVKNSYNDESDAMIMDGDKVLYKLREGEFFIFFPEEPHMPGIMKDEKREVKKIVIKIKA